ncbi:RNA polymerase factor sigma-54 [Pseudorhodoplanes sp.]|uniref:RNA polymerase factor sigma-54 n=1 Tax=Pseudorhodoplanes sp. TaxID=1934341 RepID=UPI003D0DB6DF
MALTTRLEFRQSQALVMTPQLMQAIKLLQLSNLELTAYVEEELERNPLLERSSGDESSAPEGETRENRAEPSEELAATDRFADEAVSSPDGVEDRLGNAVDNVYADDDEPLAKSREPDIGGSPEWASSGGSAASDYNLEAFVAAEVTLVDHLASQLVLAIADPVRRLIGQYLIDLIDEAGYLKDDLAAICEKLGVTRDDVEATLAIIQTFDPPGIGARNLSECLAIQLRQRDRFDPAMAALVGHLDLLAKRDFAALRRTCNVDEEDLADMIGELRALNPKPGLAFGSAEVQPVLPDVFVRQGPDGGWLVELNTDTLPKVLLNQNYHARVSKSAANIAEKNYLANCLQTATWLIRALDQRARTILKVSAEIVKQQDAFFTHGVQHLRPLNLKMIADAIKMHESTVSRVTTNKYMATNRGIFELKYFFTSAIAAADGGQAHSAEAVRHRIRQMVDSEDADAVLSDDTIVEKLRETGIDIARRTVAKYREAMRIPSSVQRRREKRVATP